MLRKLHLMRPRLTYDSRISEARRLRRTVEFAHGIVIILPMRHSMHRSQWKSSTKVMSLEKVERWPVADRPCLASPSAEAATGQGLACPFLLCVRLDSRRRHTLTSLPRRHSATGPVPRRTRHIAARDIMSTSLRRRSGDSKSDLSWQSRPHFEHALHESRRRRLHIVTQATWRATCSRCRT